MTPPPSAPRAVNRRVRWRAGMDPRVRFAWLLGIVLLLIGVGFIIAGLHARYLQMLLIKHGTPVEATVFQAGEEQVRKKMAAPESVVILHFDWHGQMHETRARVLEGRKDAIVIGGTIPIRVDADDPDNWTPLTEPLPLLQQILGGLLLMPVAFLAFVVSLWLYEGVLRLWRGGQAIEAIALDAHNSALAPMSHAVRCTPTNEQDKRVFTVCVPPKAGKPNPGDVLWVLCPSERSTRAVAAAWFE